MRPTPKLDKDEDNKYVGTIQNNAAQHSVPPTSGSLHVCSVPKKIEWYESGHFLPNEAFQDMAGWLGAEIGIDATQFTGP